MRRVRGRGGCTDAADARTRILRKSREFQTETGLSSACDSSFKSVVRNLFRKTDLLGDVKKSGRRIGYS